MGFNLQTPKGAIGAFPAAPGTTTNANRMSIDMSQDGITQPPQTPGGNKVPSLDMSKVAGA